MAQNILETTPSKRAPALIVAGGIFLIALLNPQTSQAFGMSVHGPVTQQVMAQYGFDAASQERAVAGNAYVDTQWPDWHATHFDSEKFSEGSQLLRMRIDLIIAALARCDRQTALFELGHAFHAVQDFMSHSTWVEMHQRDPSLQLPDFLNLQDPPATLNCSSRHDFDGLTTGYWPSSSKPANKCGHDELNKDTFLQNGLTGWHDIAAKWAVPATEQYMKAVLTAIRDRQPERAELMIELFKAEPVSLGRFQAAGLCTGNR